MSVPAVPEPADPSWDLRASNQERDEVVTLLREQLSAGRLDLVEFEDRTATAMAARTPRELAVLFEDLPVRWTPESVAPAGPPARRHEPGRSRDRSGRAPDRSGRSFVALWLALCVLWWGIWAATSLGAGEPLFPWPLFPMLGMGLPVIIGAFRRLLGVEDDD